MNPARTYAAQAAQIAQIAQVGDAAPATEGPTPGHLLREARRRHGVSQARLAIRAGTTQSAISRIERDQVSPTVATLRELLHLLGEDLRIEATPREWGIDRSMTRSNLSRDPEQRVRRGLDFADFVRRHRGAAQHRTRAAG